MRFDFGSTRVVIPADVAATVVEDAKASPLVMLRGRTDGTSDAPAESRIARDRAAAVRDYLLALDSSDEGKKKLEPTKWKGFAAYDHATLMALGTWLGL